MCIYTVYTYMYIYIYIDTYIYIYTVCRYQVPQFRPRPIFPKVTKRHWRSSTLQLGLAPALRRARPWQPWQYPRCQPSRWAGAWPRCTQFPAVMKRGENPEILLGRKLMELRKKFSATFDLPEATPIFHVLDIPSGNLT